MTSTAFYPEMGVDVIAPLMVDPRITKIYAIGPIPKECKKYASKTKGIVESTVNYITKLMLYGSTSFDHDLDDSEDYAVDFFPDISEKIKTVHMKKKKLWILDYKKFNDERLTIWYYYGASLKDRKLPFTERVDYIIHKNYELTDNALRLIESVVDLKKTKVIAPEDELTLQWGLDESFFESIDRDVRHYAK